MVPDITIIDYGTGNVASIVNMLRRADVTCEVTGEPERLAHARKLILPGVGHYDHGVAQLRQRGLVELLCRKAGEERVPILGICLGAQLLLERSEEGSSPGLGLIAGEVKRFRLEQVDRRLKVPHMGWTDVTPRKESALFREMHDEPRFYFVHSYHMTCREGADVLATSVYGQEFVAAVERGNVFGVQFHPEKSHKFGMRLLKSFAQYAAAGGSCAA